MPYARISADDKQRIVDCHLRGEDFLVLATQLGIKRTTAYTIVRRSLGRGGAAMVPRGGRRHAKVTDEIRNTLAEIVDAHPEYTLNQINNELRNRLPIARRISTTTVSNTLHGSLIVMKKLEDAPAERNSINTKQLRHQFADWLMRNQLEFVFIDEAGVNLWLKRTRGRAVRGQRAVRVVAGRRGHNYTMTFSVSPRLGLVHHNLSQGGMTKDRFADYLQETYRQYPAVPGHEVVLIMDNASAHKDANLLDLPQGFSVKYLPPYSPFLNITEQAFSMLKARVKLEMAEIRNQLLTQPFDRQMASVAQVSEQGIVAVTPASMAAAFRHMQTYIPACFGNEDIYM